MIRSYSELHKRSTFLERFEYLALDGEVGVATFGFERNLNQAFYTSPEWKSVRDQVIIRDNGCDLGIESQAIHDRVLVHHMNPIQIEDLKIRNEDILNPEFLICVSHRTHNAIHYGNRSQLPREFVERRPNDQSPWRWT